MGDKIDELVKYRLEKAAADLKASESLLSSGLFSQSVNRSYYAMFHAARAVLALDRFDSKRHSGVVAFFNQRYIKTGKIELSYFAMLTRAQQLRNNSDYDDFYQANEEDAKLLTANAREFIERVKSYMNSLRNS